MPAIQSPFFGINYGWAYGENNWDSGMNLNMQVMSFLHAGAVDSVTATLPGSPSNGDSVIYTVDNQLYVRIGGAWVFITPKKGMEVNENTTGKKWQFDGSGWIEVTFVSKPDLASTSDIAKGSSLVGHKGRTLRQKLLDYIDVQDYGAIGSGDETSLIQQAISDAVSTGKKWIKLGDNKTYTVTTLTSISQVNFYGNNSRFTNGYYRVYDTDAYGQLRVPSSFTTFWPNAITLNADGSAGTDFDPRAMKASGKRYYVRHTGGASGNDGLTFATALNSINLALSKPDVVEVVLQPGDYPRTNNAVGSYTLPRNISMSVLGGGRARIFGCDLNLVWTVNGTFSNVYQISVANTSGLRMIWDSKYPDQRGDFLEYSSQTSVADVSTNPGSFYWDGAVMYVRTVDDRGAPDVDIRMWRDTSFIVSGPFNFYTENIDFVGVQNVVARAPALDQTPTWVGVDCTFKYSDSSGISGGGSFRTEGGNSIMVRCTAAKSARDGFNYHQFNSILANCGWHVEVDCIGRDNGATGAGNNQGSTIHDGGKIIRINGLYARNEGPNLEDTHPTTESYNVGCTLEDSYRLTTTRHIQSTDNAVMYCVGIKMKGVASIDVVASAGGKLYHYKCGFTRFSGATTDIQQFNPVVAI